MKRAAQTGRNTAGLEVCRRIIPALAGPLLALVYCHAAQRDENAGYELTAAMEWRKAAELLHAIPAAADRCWRHWEELMRLPRRLAGPIGAPRSVQDSVSLAYQTSTPGVLTQSDVVLRPAA